MDYASLVGRVKAELEARGVVLTGPDGAFEITKRVAWLLRAEGAGLLAKDYGNNSDGFAVDIIAFSSGQIYDILINGGGDEVDGVPVPGSGNGPAWNDAGIVDRARWRAPFDPGPLPIPAELEPAPAEPAPPAGGPSQLDRIEAEQRGIREELARIRNVGQQIIDALRQQQTKGQ